MNKIAKKQLKRIKLYGYLEDHTRAKTHEAKLVAYFSDAERKQIKTYVINKEIIIVNTRKSQSRLKKHKSLNYYLGVINGIKVQVSLKKLVGEVRYWA